MNLSKVCTSGLIIFCLATCAAVGENKEFSISGNLAYRNVNVDLAVNSNNGDVLVAWQQLSWDGPIGKIYTSYGRHKGNGKFKMSKPRLISKESDFSQVPHLAFSEAGNNYLVIWVHVHAGADIRGRLVNTKGRASGGILNLFAEANISEQSAIISALPGSGNAAVLSAAYLLAWENRAGTTAGDGLWSALVDAKGQRFTKPIRILKPESPQWGYITDRMIATDSSVYLTLRDTVGAKLLKLDTTGRFKSMLALTKNESVGESRVAELSKKLLLTSWPLQSENTCLNQAVKMKLKKSKKPYSVMDTELKATELISLDGGGACQLVETPGGAYMVVLNARGKIAGDPVALNLSSSLTWGARALQIPGTNKIFLAFVKFISSNSQEITGTILELPD